MAIKYESILLNEQYIKELLNAFPEIKDKTYLCDIRHSDNLNSNSIYVSFYFQMANGYFAKGSTLRISDHNAFFEGVSFIVNPNNELSKSRKKSMVNILKSTLDSSKKRIAKFCLNKVLNDKN